MAVKAGTAFETDTVKLSLKYSGVFMSSDIRENGYYEWVDDGSGTIEDGEVIRAVAGKRVGCNRWKFRINN